MDLILTQDTQKRPFKTPKRALSTCRLCYYFGSHDAGRYAMSLCVLPVIGCGSTFRTLIDVLDLWGQFLNQLGRRFSLDTCPRKLPSVKKATNVPLKCIIGRGLGGIRQFALKKLGLGQQRLHQRVRISNLKGNLKVYSYRTSAIAMTSWYFIISWILVWITSQTHT